MRKSLKVTELVSLSVTIQPKGYVFSYLVSWNKGLHPFTASVVLFIRMKILGSLIDSFTHSFKALNGSLACFNKRSFCLLWGLW